MSDYYGEATLEDWLAEEVFEVGFVPREVVRLFEPWRRGVEENIESWMASDDGEGYPLSWRGWGRGFYAIGEDESDEFEELVKQGHQMMQSLP